MSAGDLPAVDRRRVAHIARELIRRESEAPPGNEGAAGEYAAELLAGLGLEVRRQDCGGGRSNIFARLVGGLPGPAILYCGHLDVVPADPAGWQTPPYDPEERQGRLYGRGACDMKGSIAAVLHAVELLAPRRQALAGTAALLLDVDEEHRNLGLRTWLERPLIHPDLVVVGEPTGLEVCLGHRGVMALRVVFSGVSAHAARPEGGRNAVAAGALLAGLVGEWNRRLQSQPASVLGPGSATVTMLHGGGKVNMVPDRCTVDIDRRLTSGETRAACLDQLGELVARVEATTGCVGSVEATTYSPGGLQAASGLQDTAHPLVRDAIRAAGEVTGRGTTGIFPATCEAGFFLEQSIPTVILGPGSIGQAHTVDEWISLSQLEQGAAVFTRLFGGILWGQQQKMENQAL